MVITPVELISLAGSLSAYIDPGSGSAIISAVIGVIVALGIALKTYWYKIKRFFTGSKPEDGKAPIESEQGK